MGHRFAEIAFTPAVRALQAQLGSRGRLSRLEGEAARNHVLGPDEARFIGERDSFYMASVSETGWPYVQHRGGPKGFVRVLDGRTLGFADFRGNRQYVSVGYLMENERVSLLFMDYPNRARLKLLGRAKIVAAGDTAAIEKLAVPGYEAHVERGLLISVEAFDWNCSQHIKERYALEDVEQAVASLRTRIMELEAELARARTGQP
jgi:predicted pyridoxine 5'-phosphate oxidase superfamily flavin-nucleotide-binding protein